MVQIRGPSAKVSIPTVHVTSSSRPMTLNATGASLDGLTSRLVGSSGTETRQVVEVPSTESCWLTVCSDKEPLCAFHQERSRATRGKSTPVTVGSSNRVLPVVVARRPHAPSVAASPAARTALYCPLGYSSPKPSPHVNSPRTVSHLGSSERSAASARASATSSMPHSFAGEVAGDGRSAREQEQLVVVVDDRVVAEGHLSCRSLISSAEVVGPGLVVPPSVGGPVVVGAVEHDVELEDETGGRDAERPNLGVLAVAAFRPVLPLPGQVVCDARVGPGEGVLAITDHVEGPIPAPVFSRRLVQIQHHQEPALAKEHAVGGDGVELQPPRLDAACRPFGDVILTDEVLGVEELREVVVVGPLWIVAELGRPIVG